MRLGVLPSIISWCSLGSGCAALRTDKILYDPHAGKVPLSLLSESLVRRLDFHAVDPVALRELQAKRPFGVHGHFSLTCCVRFGYGSPRGVSVPERGIRRWTGAPPLFASRIGTAGPADVHYRAIALGGAPVSIIPGGKATNDNP